MAEARTFDEVDPSVEPQEASVAASGVSDQATGEDTLGFGPYVSALAHFLAAERTQPPLTLSVEGEWGTGKSSFMLQLQKTLERDGHPTVHFNAWRHDQAEQLWAAFALHFIKELAGSLKSWRRWLASFRLWWHRFDLRSGWPRLLGWGLSVVVLISVAGAMAAGVAEEGVAWFEPLLGEGGSLRLGALLKLTGAFGIVGLGYITLRGVTAAFGNPLRAELEQYLDRPDYRRHTAFIEEFHQDFQAIVRAYAPSRRVFVFIDDLDRCEVPRSAELMQAINLLVSDSPQLVFIIGMDRAKVAAGLAVKFADLLRFIYPDAEGDGGRVSPWKGYEFGYDFIEKFIQLPFQVPRPTRREIERMLEGENGDVTPAPDEGARRALVEVQRGEDSPEVREIVLMAAPALDFNPRRVKQFLNAFRLKAHVAHNTGLFGWSEGEAFWPLTLERLGKFVALSLRWPRVLAEAEDDPRLLDELQLLALRDSVGEQGAKDVRNEVLDRDPENPSDGELVVMGRAEEWAADRDLLRLLRYGLDGPDAPDDQTLRRFSVFRLDLERLLQTSPRTRAAERGAASEQAPPGPLPPEAMKRAEPPSGDAEMYEQSVTA